MTGNGSHDARWARRWAGVYGASLSLLPAESRRYQGDMTAALEEQLVSARSIGGAIRALVLAFGRLPLVLVREWMDAFRDARRSSGPRGPRGVLTQNLRFAVRTLRNNPTFALVSIFLIGLGVGAVTAVFTVVDHVLLRPLPYPEQERIHYLTNGAHNGATLRALAGVETLDAWVATRPEQLTLTRVGAEPLRLTSAEVTSQFFSLFGARPALGRVLVPDDEVDRSAGVITHEAWMSVWGGDPSVVGTTVQLNAEPVTVVGVLAADFVVPERLIPRDTRVFRPMNWADPRLENPGYHAHSVAARLAPGVELGAAQAEMDRVRATLLEEEKLSTRQPGTWPLVPLKEMTVRDASDGLFLLLGSVGLLLLVACANVALLFMARGMSRVREMSVRRALGAGTRTLVGQLATESLLVGLAGGLFGLVVARASLLGFDRWIGDLPRADGIELDARVLLFTILLSGATALVFGLAPALRSVRQDVSSQLCEGGRSATQSRGVRWVRSGLIIGEVGVSLVLVALAGLLLRSFLTVTAQDPGVDPEGVWVAQLNITLADQRSPDEFRRRLDGVLDAIERAPGVTSATYGLEMPFEFTGGGTCCWGVRSAPMDVVDLRADERSVLTFLHPVSEDFFETLGTHLVAGTTWTSADATSPPWPVVLSESLAIRHFGSAPAALGQELKAWMLGPTDGPVRVVGVAEPTLHYGLDQTHPPAMYVPIEALRFPNPSGSFAVKMADGTDVFDVLRTAIWSVERDIPVTSVVPLQTWVDESSGVRRLSSALSSAFGAIALLLAAGGLYGTLLYAASERRRELGIRIALGAGRRRIQREVVANGVGLAVAGLVLGIPAAIALGRLLESFLWNTSVTDPVTLVVASTVLVGTAALASWLPAYRASRTDPLEVLKAE